MHLVLNARASVVLEQNQPLYQRVPTRDESGRCLGDFMLLIPGLRDRPGHDFAIILARLQAVLIQFSEIVFVDLNLPLNLLWVSVRPRPGVILEVLYAVRLQIPEVKLVGHRWQ